MSFCKEPANLKGKLLLELIQSGDLSQFTCNLEECPHPSDPNCVTESCQVRPVCTCTDNQLLDVVVVNCSNLKEMPAFVPYGYWKNAKIELNVENGSMTLAKPTDYLSRITKLSFVNAPVVEIHASFLGGLNSNIEIQFSPQELPEIPIEFFS
ncbi:hypothetical protein DPMN_104116 [Dreissena polymorpha]|uniref:Uncharacterized protein n=1 Tax=Dreissena polymorpha TaxID=45954 RepID=A0A9D4H9B2_DREPO|nr:hypothetical protein DPMN_104116 [Dreissena polymorpha]